MTDKPIIFSAPMVRALLDGRKTQTRRLLKGRSGIIAARSVIQNGLHWLAIEYDRSWPLRLPYAPGDRLYVREAFSYDRLDVDRDGTLPPWYWADGNPSSGDWSRPKPSIFCPRWASRITLTVTEVRVQRLQEISREDAIAEGIEGDTDGWFDYLLPATQCCARPQDSYATLWNSLHGPDAWDANPWVVALTFTVQYGNIDQVKS